MDFKRVTKQIFLALLLMGFALVVNAQANRDQDLLLQTLEKELDRNMQVLKGKPEPVYLLSYRVDEVKKYSIGATFGDLTSSDSTLERILTIQVRLGSMALDNFHELRDDASEYFRYRRYVYLPLNDEPEAIAQILWRETDETYREAVKRFEKIKANVAVKVESDDKAPDYSIADVNQYYAPKENWHVNVTDWENRLQNYAALLAHDKAIIKGTATARFVFERKYYVNSDGTSIVQNQTYSHLYVSGEAQADDGMELPLHNSYFAHLPTELPNDRVITEDTKEMIATLIALKNAPIVDPYTGPALLTSEAAGVFFHEIFGHRVEGQRMKQESDGQTFKKKLNEEILNPDISVIFDPTIMIYKGIPLNGSFLYDDEGVKGEKTIVVDQGVLKNFLMTRTPIDNFPKSNGHARAQAGLQPVSRQSNLIVETNKPYTDSELRTMLIEEAKAQGREYGYLFHRVQGGFTMTGRYMPNSFNVTPLEVYRIYVDGREDEIVRGVDLVGTPLAMFSQIEGVGDTPGNFAGTCGAESGGIPAGCCSPALFVKRIEMQKKSKAQNRPPVLERTYNEDATKEYDSFEEMAFQAMEEEIKRNIEGLKISGLQDPYFISYLVTDASMSVVESSLGGVIVKKSKPYRSQETQVFVGNNKKNNLNYVDENSLFGSRGGFSISVPKKNQYNSFRNSLWLSTDRNYKRSAEMIEAKKAAIEQQNLSQKEIDLPDFSEVKNEKHLIEGIEENVQLTAMEELSVQLSGLLKNYPHFTNSGANIYAYQANALYRNSDGMQYQQPFSLVALRVFAETISDEGEPLMNYFTLYFNQYSQLPSLEELKIKTKEMADLLEQLRKAPVIDESYSGPVMFVGEAVGEIVAQTFVESKTGLLAGRKNVVSNPDLLRWYGEYLPAENTIENMKGKKVISRNLSVSTVTGKTTFHDIPLIGAYQLDAEGVVPSQQLSLIHEGVLQNLLTDRIPTAQFSSSNGHKRLALAYGRLTTSLCSGVIEVTGKEKMSYEKMKKKLIAMAKEEDYEYAYIVKQIAATNSNVPGLEKYLKHENYYRPFYVVRINVKDGAETILRTAKVSALSMKSFKQAVAISNQQQVYNTLLDGNNRMIGPGWDFDLSGVPCSFIVPTAILFQELEVEKDQNVVLRKQPEVTNPLVK